MAIDYDLFLKKLIKYVKENENMSNEKILIKTEYGQMFIFLCMVPVLTTT